MILVAVVLGLLTVAFFSRAENAEDYVEKGWCFILSVVLFITTVYFTSKSFERGNSLFPNYTNKSYYYNDNFEY